LEKNGNLEDCIYKWILIDKVERGSVIYFTEKMLHNRETQICIVFKRFSYYNILKHNPRKSPIRHYPSHLSSIFAYLNKY
jgi:hypothetical protein